MSNQRRFSGSSIEEALRAARVTLGDGVRLVSAERVTKPGLIGKRVHFTVVVEPPPPPVSAQGFAAALRSAILDAPARTNDADEEDYRAVQAELAETYRSESMARPLHKVFRRDGRVLTHERVGRPSFARTSVSTTDARGNQSEAQRADRAPLPPSDRAEGGPVDGLVIDIAGDQPVLRIEEPSAFHFLPEHRVVSVVAPGVLFPLEAFRRIAEAAGVPEEHRFVLGQCSEELPSELLAPASLIARSIHDAPRTVVLVDPRQLSLLRRSFLDAQMAVVAALETLRPTRELASELAAIGRVDALCPIGDARLIEGLGLPIVRDHVRRG
jgi:hypothetical protein